LDFSGLLDINGTVVGTPTTTGFVMKITTDYGSALNPEPVTGLVLADFDLYNDTGAASVTPTSVTESPSGTYTFVIPSQTSGDDMTLTLASGVTGYDDTDLESATISIP
jgi:hypothetical protein